MHFSRVDFSISEKFFKNFPIIRREIMVKESAKR